MQAKISKNDKIRAADKFYFNWKISIRQKKRRSNIKVKIHWIKCRVWGNKKWKMFRLYLNDWRLTKLEQKRFIFEYIRLYFSSTNVNYRKTFLQLHRLFFFYSNSCFCKVFSCIFKPSYVLKLITSTKYSISSPLNKRAARLYLH